MDGQIIKLWKKFMKRIETKKIKKSTCGSTALGVLTYAHCPVMVVK
jgi:hypothetical protein